MAYFIKKKKEFISKLFQWSERPRRSTLLYKDLQEELKCIQ